MLINTLPTKKGVKDIQVEAILTNFAPLGLFDAYLIEFENDSYDHLNLNQKIILKDKLLIKLVNEKQVNKNFQYEEEDEDIIKIGGIPTNKIRLIIYNSL